MNRALALDDRAFWLFLRLGLMFFDHGQALDDGTVLRGENFEDASALSKFAPARTTTSSPRFT